MVEIPDTMTGWWGVNSWEEFWGISQKLLSSEFVLCVRLLLAVGELKKTTTQKQKALSFFVLPAYKLFVKTKYT